MGSWITFDVVDDAVTLKMRRRGITCRVSIAMADSRSKRLHENGEGYTDPGPFATAQSEMDLPEWQLR
jgi:hypothetical protein